MKRFRVGVMDTALVGRPAVDAITLANYVSAAVGRVDSFWVPDHLNGLLPRALWTADRCGGAKLFPHRRTARAMDHTWLRCCS